MKILKLKQNVYIIYMAAWEKFIFMILPKTRCTSLYTQVHCIKKWISSMKFVLLKQWGDVAVVWRSWCENVCEEQRMLVMIILILQRAIFRELIPHGTWHLLMTVNLKFPSQGHPFRQDSGRRVCIPLPSNWGHNTHVCPILSWHILFPLNLIYRDMNV